MAAGDGDGGPKSAASKSSSIDYQCFAGLWNRRFATALAEEEEKEEVARRPTAPPPPTTTKKRRSRGVGVDDDDGSWPNWKIY